MRCSGRQCGGPLGTIARRKRHGANPTGARPARVLRFPDQHLDLASLKRFSEFFGEIQGNPIRDADPMREYPEIGTLSNLKEGGKYIGSPDAGQDWHTDMTYREVPGFVNVLYGIRIPHRDGKPLGGTEFSNMHLAYEALPSE